ncbi:MAG TPA: hypothetical protein VGP41_04180, partial [Candidatus Lustribacter sp.]|nr:hypothetical protein [Candidatus Lustribacter sp.]
MNPSAETPPRPWPPYVARETVLRELERAIAATPDALDTHFYYASFLRDHGQFEAAIAEFEHVLARAPDHVETLVALGVVLARRGRRLDARAQFEHAVARDGAHGGALVNLANVLVLDEPERAQALYETALRHDAAYAAAHRGLCGLAAARGDAAATSRHREAGYAGGPFGRRPYLGATMPPEVLTLVSTDGGNIPLEALIDEHRFLVHEVYVEAYDGEVLPPHALIVNAIADADRCAPALQRASELVKAARVPVVNAPRAVAATGRVANAARLAGLTDVVAPAARFVGRASPAPNTFPFVLRVQGMHMGRGMIRIDDASAFAQAIATTPPRDERIAIDYVDTRSRDGAWRKYRVM